MAENSYPLKFGAAVANAGAGTGQLPAGQAPQELELFLARAEIHQANAKKTNAAAHRDTDLIISPAWRVSETDQAAQNDAGRNSHAARYCRRLLFVLKEFDLAEAFFCFFFRFVRAAEIFALFRKHFVTAGNFFDHAALREDAMRVKVRSNCG